MVSGSPYSLHLGASGGAPPYRFAVTGQLPPGLALNPPSGLVAGTMTPPGGQHFPVSFAVADDNGRALVWRK